MIEEVIVLTIERSVERHWAWLAASKLRGIPEDNISYIKGHFGEDFGDMQAIAEAAARDGFGFVEEYAIGTRTEYVQQTPGSVSQIWNYGRILRYIIDSGKTCLVIVDDKMITIQYGILFLIVNELVNQSDKEFYLFQLRQRGDLNELDFKEKDRHEMSIFTHDIFNAVFHNEIFSYKNFFTKHGVSGYEETMVISPGGANWILDNLHNAGDFYIFYDHFIKTCLSEQAEHKKDKGIYCPAEAGFSFASEIMPMGSTTHWAPEGSHHYIESQESTSIPWKEIP